jgi:hypothetical protein
MANNTKLRNVEEKKDNKRAKVAEARARKGFWHKLADRLVDNSCTKVPTECR